MKKINICFLLVSFVFFSCEGKLDYLIEENLYTISKDPQYAFISSEDSVNVEGSASSFNVDIESAKTPWTLSTNASWIHFAQESGIGNATVSCSVDTNPSGEDSRSAKVRLLGGSSPSEIKVVQRPAEASVEASSDNLLFPPSGGQAQVLISSNTSIDLNIIEDWLDANLSGDTLTVNVDPIEGNYSRSGYINLNYNHGYEIGYPVCKSYSIMIEQEAPIVNGLNNEYYISNKQQTSQVDITSNVDWSIESSQDWLHVSPTNGKAKETTTVTIIADENQYGSLRLAELDFQWNNINFRTITFYQNNY